MRVAVYTDYVYREIAGRVYAERAFALFLAGLATPEDPVILIGRRSPERSDRGYALGPDVKLAPLQHYESLANPAQAVGALAGSFAQLWRSLDDVDVLWALGPYPHAMLLVLMARLRRRAVVLGVRQDWPTYVRRRRPGRRVLHRLADVMEGAWRGLGRHYPTVAVGAELAEHYAKAPMVLDLCVSLVPRASIGASPPVAPGGPERALTILTVGRLEEEKNPLLLAEILAELHRGGTPARLVVVGDGPLAEPLRQRAGELGLSAALELRGYVPMGPELLGLYRDSDLFLHVSWTEGFPQTLIEAFASGLPTVATAVGGVPAGVSGCALLVPPGDAGAAARAVEELAGDATLSRRLASAGLGRAAELSQEAQTDKLRAFLHAASDRQRR